MSLHPESGRVVGNRYSLTRPIASGGMGDVWEARDTVLAREVAVKILRTGDGPADEGFTERFRDEAKHAAALTHPNVAAVYDYGEEEDGTAYLVMERVPGLPLTEIIRQGGVDPAQVRWILGQAALALAAAHDSGLVHRDVKPGNIIVTPEGAAKLTDFGIARAGDGNGHTLTGEVLGTPDYISPEQALGEPATNASDIYSLGVVAHEMLSGAKPFDMGTPVATALAHVNDTPPALPDSVPADLRAVVEACLAKSPQDRPSDAREVAVALGMPSDPVAPVVAVAAATTRLATVAPTTPRWQTRAQALAYAEGEAGRNRRFVWLIAPLAAVLVIVGAFGLGSLFSSTASPTTSPPASVATTTPPATVPSPTTTTTTTTTTATSTQAPAPAKPAPAPAEKGKGKPADPGKGKGNK